MGVRKRTRVVIGMVGVIESWGSAVCITSISSCSAILYESLRKVYRRISTSLLTHGLFIVAVVQTHRMNLLKGHIVFLICLLLLLACLVLWLLVKHVFILYTDGKADLSDRGNPKPKGTNSSFYVRGENLTSAKKLHELIQLSKNICLCLFKLHCMSLTEDHDLCVLLTFHICNTG